MPHLKKKKDPKCRQNASLGYGAENSLLELVLFVITKPIWEDFLFSSVQWFISCMEQL